MQSHRSVTIVWVGYKLFAMVPFQRFRTAAAEERIWPAHFVPRTKRGGATFFLARKLCDRTLADRNGTLLRLSLDWAKAVED